MSECPHLHVYVYNSNLPGYPWSEGGAEKDTEKTYRAESSDGRRSAGQHGHGQGHLTKRYARLTAVYSLPEWSRIETLLSRNSDITTQKINTRYYVTLYIYKGSVFNS